VEGAGHTPRYALSGTSSWQQTDKNCNKNLCKNSDCNSSILAYNRKGLQRECTYCNNVGSLAECFSLPEFSRRVVWILTVL